MRISVVLDCLDPDALVPFWQEALAYQLVDSLDGYRILVPREGEPPGPVLILQPVPEPKTVKNRMHVDVHPDDAAAHVRHLEALGATRLGEPVEAFGVSWQTLADPEGHELCIVAHGRLDLDDPAAAGPDAG
jgi:predicted enzyme related to lactoylglutathione lyase